MFSKVWEVKLSKKCVWKDRQGCKNIHEQKRGKLYEETINEKMMQIRKERKEKERTEFTECSIIQLMQEKEYLGKIGMVQWIICVSKQ